MRIRELVEQLIKHYEAHGDIEVLIFGSDPMKVLPTIRADVFNTGEGDVNDNVVVLTNFERKAAGDENSGD